jgi:hypothetical protein
MAELVGWLFLIACGLAVVWGCVEDIRWRAHRVDPWDELQRKYGDAWWEEEL